MYAEHVRGGGLQRNFRALLAERYDQTQMTNLHATATRQRRLCGDVTRIQLNDTYQGLSRAQARGMIRVCPLPPPSSVPPHPAELYKWAAKTRGAKTLSGPGSPNTASQRLNQVI